MLAADRDSHRAFSEGAGSVTNGDGFKFDRMSADPLDKFKFKNDGVPFILNPKGVSFVKDRWTSLDGLTKGTATITLGVAFLNGDEQQKQMVRDAASVWTSPTILGPRLAFHFDAPLALSCTDNTEADALAHTALFTKVIEDYIRKYPDQWLWVHRRWKTRPQGEAAIYT